MTVQNTVRYSSVCEYSPLVQWAYATCSSVQRLLSALSCFVSLTQGFIKCRVGRHDAGGLWKCVLVCVLVCVCVCVCVCGRLAWLCVYSSVYWLVCKMFPQPGAHACVCIWLHICALVLLCVCVCVCVCVCACTWVCVRVGVCFLLFLTQGLCPLKGVPASQLRDRGQQGLKPAMASELGRKQGRAWENEREREGETGERRKVAPVCGVCCFEARSRCLCTANIANTTLQVQAWLGVWQVYCVHGNKIQHLFDLYHVSCYSWADYQEWR